MEVAGARTDVGQRSETVRRANLSAIVREAARPRSGVALQLVARTGLTRSAIRGLIGELALAGIVSENEPARLGTPGRPSPVVRPQSAGAVVLALEIAVDSLAAPRRRARRRGLRRSCASTGPAATPPSTTIAADLADLAGSVRRRRPDRRPAGRRRRRGRRRRPAARRAGRRWRRTWAGATCRSVSGSRARSATTVGPDRGRQRRRPRRSRRARRGAAVGADDVLFLSGEDGVGGGVIVDGQPLTGAAGYGGEVGHMPVNPDGSPCRCGSVGCWETEVGEAALLRRAGHPPRRRSQRGRRRPARSRRPAPAPRWAR